MQVIIVVIDYTKGLHTGAQNRPTDAVDAEIFTDDPSNVGVTCEGHCN